MSFSINLQNNPGLWKQAIFKQDDCCSKLWPLYLGSTKEHPKVDPALHLKKLGYRGLFSKAEDIVRTIIVEKCSMLTNSLKKHSLLTVKGLLISGPAGSGKTFLVKHLPHLLNCQYHNLQIVHASKIFEAWEKISKAYVQFIFKTMFEAAINSKNPNKNFLLVIDEIDLILSKDFRESHDLWKHSIINNFLTEMQDLKKIKAKKTPQ